MIWLQQNPSAFLIASGICLFGALGFLFDARVNWKEASVRFGQSSSALRRLEQLAPYPNEENLRQMKTQADAYGGLLTRSKEELRKRVPPCPPLAPNEFQSQLRLATTSITERAQARGVQLPDKFHLGFDEYASGLPNEIVAPLLGQELTQVEWILELLIDAKVDSLVSFRRTPLLEEKEVAPVALISTSTTQKRRTITPAASGLLERNVVEVSFVSTSDAARQVLNQIAAASGSLLVIRLLHVQNEEDKGPQRVIASGSGGGHRDTSPLSPVSGPKAKSIVRSGLNFIVGSERIETTATIEIVRLKF